MGRPRRTLVPLDAEIVPVVDASALVAQPDTLPAPQRSPAQQKLADAIATVAALEAEITAAQIAVNDADETKWKAFATLRDAEEELERAKPQPWGSGLKPREPWTFANQENADAYNAKLNEGPPSIEWAKEAVPRATDARDSALTAVQFHRKRLDTAVGHLQWKCSNIDEALRLAVHYDPAMAALATETKRLVTAAAAARRAFDTAVGSSFLTSDHLFYGTTDPTNPSADLEGWAVAYRWRAALHALRTDPDAVLPIPSQA